MPGLRSSVDLVVDYGRHAFWTVYYFILFLIRGDPKLKSESSSTASESKTPKTTYIVNDVTERGPSNHISTPSRFSTFNSSNERSFWTILKDYASQTWQFTTFYAKRIGHFLYRQSCRLWKLLVSLWQWLKSFFSQPISSKTLPPCTPKPFVAQTSCDSPTYNKVFFEPQEIMDLVADEDNEPPTTINDTSGAPQLSTSGDVGDSFYAQRTFNRELEMTPVEAVREPSMPPPAPPPPPPKPIRIGTSVSREPSVAPIAKEPKEVKGGVASFPADVMAELHGTQRMRQERGQSAQREMTQSCHPDMAEWKNVHEDRRERAMTPSQYRANSVGPTMRRLEQVVSRLEDSNENESQFVFRPKNQVTEQVYDDQYHRNNRTPVNNGNDSDTSGFRLGRSVFSPVEEVEQYRDSINRRATNYDSRPTTPAYSHKSFGAGGGGGYGSDHHDYRASTVFNAPSQQSYNQHYNPFGGGSGGGHQARNYNNTPTPFQQNESQVRRRARTVGPREYEPVTAPAPFTPSTAYSSAPFTSHTARRSKTPVSFERDRANANYDRSSNFAYDRDDVTQGTVVNTVSQWPPVSNATGAPLQRDNWLNSVIQEQALDDGLITTMCRRVVERKVEDNWKWRDENGQLIDEQNQKSWKGELDTVLRDGPNQGRHWSRTVETLPSGDTRFQDVSRQYDHSYVVESVIRNY